MIVSFQGRITSERGGLRRRRHAGLLLDVLQHVDQQLGRAQIGAGRFADQLSDDRLALGDLSALSVDGRDHLLVERVDQQCGKFFGRGPRGLPD